MYIALDCETGGLSKSTSLLTFWFGIYREDFRLVDELYLKVKPDNGVYNVTAQGLDVNKIDLVKHDEDAVTYKEAGTKLYRFLEFNRNIEKCEKFVPIGQNVMFDIERVYDLVSFGTWDNFVSHRVLDTLVIARFLDNCGVLSLPNGFSLTTLVEHFNIKIDGNPHEAHYDAKAAVEVYKHFREIVKNNAR